MARRARPPEIKAIAPAVGARHSRRAIPSAARSPSPVRLLRDESGQLPRNGRVTEVVRLQQSGDAGRGGCSVTDGAVRRAWPADRRRPNRQRHQCPGGLSSQSMAKHQRWPVGGWRLVLGESGSPAHCRTATKQERRGRACGRMLAVGLGQSDRRSPRPRRPIRTRASSPSCDHPASSPPPARKRSPAVVVSAKRPRHAVVRPERQSLVQRRYRPMARPADVVRHRLAQEN
jgi:hypothetical protein